MQGCLSYIVAKDAADENTIWVTEAWDSMASHDTSLSLPAVKNAIPRARAIVSNFERITVTSPVWGVGLPATHAQLIGPRLGSPEVDWTDGGWVPTRRSI